MSLTKRDRSPYFRYSFTIEGVRFSGSTERTTRREALAVEKEAREEARRSLKEAPKPATMTLDDALGRYWTEVGQHATDARQARWTGFWLIEHLGADKPIKDITNDDVARLVGIRRLERVDNVMRARKRAKGGEVGPGKLVSQSTVNRSVVEPLRRVLKRASELWGEPVTPIRWRDHKLGEPKERVRYMTAEEEAAVFAVLPACYQQLVTFAVRAGCRASECVRLTWADVEWGELRVRIVGKGFKGNPKVRTVPLTPDMRDMLWSMRGDAKLNAPIFRNMSGAAATYRSYYEAFRTACRRAGITDLKVHDLRHTAATRILRTGGNLRIAQALLGHSDVSTTAKYAHILDEDLRAAMDAVSRNPHHQAAPLPSKPLKSQGT